MAGSQQRRSEGLAPDEIVNRAFPSAFRGISEPEVRAYLRRVADELRGLRDREAALAQRVSELEHTLANPTPPSEQQLLDSLGEETARVLRSAQQAAEEIRARAEERSGALLREAQSESQRLREEASSLLATETERANEAAAAIRAHAEEASSTTVTEAQAAADAIRAAADEYAAATRESADRDSESALETARDQGRAMVAEAKEIRERVLADLNRRREAMQLQIDELHVGREQIVDAFRTVKRVYTDAVQALTRTDRDIATVAASSAPVEVPVFEPTTEVPEESVVDQSSTEESVVDAEVPVVEVSGAEVPDSGGSEVDVPDDDVPDVDSIFARLRAESDEDRAVDVEAPPVEPVAELDLTAAEDATEGVAAADAELTSEVEAEAVVPELEGDAAILAARDDQVAEFANDLARALKRRLQDEQNEVLDLIRQQKKKVAVEQSLPAIDAQRAAWVEALDAPVRAAFAAGAAAAGLESAEVPSDFVAEFAGGMLEPLRERLSATIAESSTPGADLDTSDLPARVGARYREFRNQDLDIAVDAVLCAAYSRGVFEATPADAVLRWLPSEEGRCPDCDDNALEATRRGESFPTGQSHPPAHPGCRCLLVSESMERTVGRGRVATNGA